jgi:NAD(P)-dependent dehydrogenase (short-subunit alcohol dehydrogenase family)
MKPLEGKVAVVTGASRGAGRGIARALGEAGATVYVTGRSARGGPATDGLPGRVEDAAEEVTARGGAGVAVRCDHTDDAQVEALFARVRRERGRLDVLVNNVWGGYEGRTFVGEGIYFWEQPYAERWDKMFTAGLRAHVVASCLAAPLLIEHKAGLIVSTIAWDHDKYLGSFYDLSKHAIVRWVHGMAIELRRHGVAAVAVAPGFTRTERVLAAYGADEAHWRDVPALAATESPEYVGRAVVALATDPRVLDKSGRAFRAGELAAEYGFTDVDGRRVPPFTGPDDILEFLEAMRRGEGAQPAAKGGQA